MFFFSYILPLFLTVVNKGYIPIQNKFSVTIVINTNVSINGLFILLYDNNSPSIEIIDIENVTVNTSFIFNLVEKSEIITAEKQLPNIPKLISLLTSLTVSPISVSHICLKLYHSPILKDINIKTNKIFF